ncbi:hypothetical protein [Ruegeria lacuscaerulensis]|uniref:hypothetical protein n=1 Tax=Ruegeria lacuscaerulensis TaxID=55218 RepID=UPI00147FBE20|nr:hypothetical protein [Ruegeria lacuscaerulensis]
MVQNNKVLTVSYGTFSCTLEGFDDSFETMKAIAEYFRDLAAEDRYFGSEPPQPDAEMLARIAQRDAARRIEASHDDHGLVLRSTDQPAPAPIASAPLPTPMAQAEEPTVPETDPSSNAEPLAADSIAAKLQRIRAVVSHTDENTVIYAEDEETSLMNADAGPSDAVAAAFAAGTLSSSDFEEEVHDTPTLETEAPDFQGADFEETLEEPKQEDPTAFQQEPAFGDHAEPDQKPAMDEPARVNEPPVAQEPLEAQEETELAVGFEQTDLQDEPSSQDNAPEEDEEIVNILSDYAMDDEAATEDEDEDEDEEVLPEGFLTANDEEDLLSEISNVEEFLARRAADSGADVSGMDQDVSRLMDKADVQMDDPAASDQRETYSHLRAAVAATEAERSGKAPERTLADADEDEYRDMTSSISPRRPEVEVTSTRPQPEALAPLKLVAEQRVDTQASSDDPVTPRRVRAQEQDNATEEGGFALYAQEQGAQSLPDLLEAAASYLSFVEGQEQFSRPQLMNKIRSLKQDEFNREESLRSFGQLLRDGKIEKAGGGRFAASTQIGFRPDDDERAAG